MQTATKAYLVDCVATLLINGSYSVFKLGHRQVEKKEQGSRAHCKSPIWWAGFSMMMVGIIAHIAVLPYADMTLLAANSALAIIGNLFLSIWLFGEKFTWKYDFTAMVLLVGGALTIVGLSNKSQVDVEAQELLDRLSTRKAFVFYGIVGLFFAFTHYMTYKFHEALRVFETDADLFDHNLKTSNPSIDESALIFSKNNQGTEETESSDKEKQQDDQEVAEGYTELDKKRPFRLLIKVLQALPQDQLDKVSERCSTLKPYLKFPMVILIANAGVISGTSMLMLKVTDTLVQNGHLGDHWELLSLLAVLIIWTGDTQLQFLNMAIKMYDQLEVIPIYQTFCMLAWMSIGLFIFDESKFYSAGGIWAFAGAVLICLIGVKILVSKKRGETEATTETKSSSKGEKENNLEGQKAE